MYKQILISLKLSPAHRDVVSQIREQMDFATILYNKGLYQQSLKLLNKAKTACLEHQEYHIALEIVELEKLIETQHITRSGLDQAKILASQTQELQRKSQLISTLSNLSLSLYGILLKTGYARSSQEYQQITAFFWEHLPDNYQWADLGFKEKMWLYKSHLWYGFIIQDFKSCFRYARKWLSLFEDYPKMMQRYPVFFVRANHYLLESLFLSKDYDRLKFHLNKFEYTLESTLLPKDDNLKTLSFLYLTNNKLNLHFLSGSFKEGLCLIQSILDGIQKYENHLDKHHIMLFYYKIACLYFGVGDHESCILYLKKIISNKSLKLREDLMCFSRVLNLVAHYEAGKDVYLDRLIKETYRFLLKMNELYEVQKEMIRFLKNLGEIFPQDLPDAFQNLYNKLKEYEHHPYERRAFLYLDILSWLESNINGIPVSTVVERKFSSSKY